MKKETSTYINKVISTTARRTDDLRFLDGKLQQKFEICECLENHYLVNHDEWHDVPSVKSEELD